MVVETKTKEETLQTKKVSKGLGIISKENSLKFTIIDGKNLVLGRLGSNISKRLLLGENIKLLNCNDVIILGRKQFLVKRYKNKLSNKVIKQGPYYSRSPSDLVKRGFRNMLPYKNSRGVTAFKRLKCYNSVPSILASAKTEVVSGAKLDSNSVFYFTKMSEIAEALGYVKKGK